MKNNKVIILSLLVALAVGAYFIFQPAAAPQKGSQMEESHGDGKHQDDHAEGGHDHGDADEHGHEEAKHEDDHGEGEAGHGDKTEISEQAAANAEIETAEAGPTTIHETITLTGRITLNPNTTANVKARFPGIVRAANKGLGDTVSAGDVLATVESNDSLLAYPVKAPIGGIILQRNTNIGDVVGDQPMFIIANLSDVWAELFIFPRDMARIKAGQMVHIQSTDGSVKADAKLHSLLPVAEASSQTVVGRAVIDNPNLQWRSGMTVRGSVVVAEKEVPVAVATGAIQRQEGATVVFVREGTTYEARKVELGLSDPEWTEIKSGLKSGETYVAKNSFVVKADIGKASAEHEH